MQAPRLVRINYAVRTGAFAYCFLALGVHLLERGSPPLAWLLFSAQFLLYPHLLYRRALRSTRPAQAELDNLYIDSTLLGVWAAYFGFASWPTYALLGGTALSATVSRGLRGGCFSLGCSAAGAALFMASGQFVYSPYASDLVAALCAIGLLAYSCAVAHVVYQQNRRLLRTRDELRTSEERYRLIAENVADLVGMVDQRSRWLYASPSYARVLDEEELKAGTDAFQRLHPDDADLARVAVARVAATGKSRDIALRLVDREGRLRQYKTRIQALNADSTPGGKPRERLILASQDVTDLRASEERLLLQAHALEGMTEAILITAADGTVLTVNRAFCDLTGHARDDVLGRPEKDIRNALQPPEHYEEVYATVQREGYWSGTQWSRRKNGSVYREWRSIRAVRNPAGAVTHYVMMFSEVGAPKQRQDTASGKP